MKYLFPKILVCVDGSKKSQKALSKAISIAEKIDSRLTILMVIQENQIDFWDDTEFKVGETRPQVHLKNESKILKKTEKMLSYFAKRVPSRINCTTKILTGDPTIEILNFSKKNKTDLIILGSKGTGGFSKLLLGSVSSKVSDHASTSVLIVR